MWWRRCAVFHKNIWFTALSSGSTLKANKQYVLSLVCGQSWTISIINACPLWMIVNRFMFSNKIIELLSLSSYWYICRQNWSLRFQISILGRSWPRKFVESAIMINWRRKSLMMEDFFASLFLKQQQLPLCCVMSNIGQIGNFDHALVGHIGREIVGWCTVCSV